MSLQIGHIRLPEENKYYQAVAALEEQDLQMQKLHHEYTVMHENV